MVAGQILNDSLEQEQEDEDVGHEKHWGAVESRGAVRALGVVGGEPEATRITGANS